jgi:hypothetical protein
MSDGEGFTLDTDEARNPSRLARQQIKGSGRCVK